MISIIIPSHNEKNINKMVEKTKFYFPDAEIIVSEDPEGKGKGWAIREGLKKATQSIVVFIDGDLEIHPKEIKKFFPYICGYDVIIGNKIIKDLSLTRKIISIGYRMFVKILFGLPINDTQTGIKIWRRSEIPKFKTDGFAFDLEMLYKAHKAGAKIKEIPIKVKINRKVKLKSITNTFKETVKLWKTLLV